MNQLDDLLSSLRAQLEKQSDFTLGQLQIINLDLIQKEAGEQWPELRAKVFDVSEHFISQRIEATDTLLRCEEGFLVVFAPENSARAEARAKRISNALNSFYLGDEFFRRLQVRSSAITVNATSLAQFLRKQGAQKPAPAPPESIMPDTGLDYEDLPRPVFEPAWDARREMIVASFCRPQRRFAGEIIMGHGEIIMGHRGIDQDDTERFSDIDLQIAATAAERITTCWQHGQRASFSFTAHYRTFDSLAARRAYLDILNTIPDDIRQRLSLAVTGIPSGAPAVKLAEMFRSARETGMILMAELVTPDTDLRTFADCNVRIFAIPSASGTGPISPADKDRYTLFNERVKAHKALVAVTGISCPHRVYDHVKLGAVFTTGPVIAPVSATPVTPTALSLALLAAPGRRASAS